MLSIANAFLQLLQEGGQGLQVTINDVVDYIKGRTGDSNNMITDAKAVLATTLNDVVLSMEGRTVPEVYVCICRVFTRWIGV